MANEIYVSTVTGNRVDLIFYFPYTQVADEVPNPSNTLYGTALEDLQNTNPVMVGQLDSGTAIFYTTHYSPSTGETAPQALAKVQAMYASSLAVYVPEVQAKHKWQSRVGNFYNAS